MSGNSNILNELNELGSSLAGNPKMEAYQVPAGYFEAFAGVVLAKIRALETADAVEELQVLSPFLSSIPKKLPYQVPAGYFNGLQESLSTVVNDRDAKEELESISPLLSGIGRSTPFAVPEGYFEKLQTGAPAEKKQRGILVGMSWRRYAAAAVMIGVITLAGLLFFTRDRIDPVEEPGAWVKKQIRKVPDTNLDEFIDISSEVTTEMASSEQPIPEVNQVLANVPDDVLEAFIDDATAADEEILLN